MNAGLLLQALVSGAAAGAIYGLVGLGYGLIFRMSAVLDFAHGDLVTAAVFVLLLVAGGGGAVALVGIPTGVLLIAALAALAAGALAGMAIQAFAVAPFLARGWSVGWIATTVAAGLFLRSLVGLRFQAESYTVPELLPVGFLGRGGALGLPGGGILQARALVVLLVAAALAIGFDRWLRLSRLGRAMRAASQDEDAARVCGISPERLRLLAWGLAGLLAAVAGLLVAPSRPLTLDLGVIIGLKGTAAAVLGRLGSARGALVAGLCLGVAESLVTALHLPAFGLGPLRVPQLGPYPGLQDVGPLLVLVLCIALLPRLLATGLEAVD